MWPSFPFACEVTRVAVRDEDFRLVKELSAGTDIEVFCKHWGTRKRTKRAAPQWNYKIDILHSGRSERWLYNLAGFTQVLSKKETPLYQLLEPLAFNRFLEIMS